MEKKRTFITIAVTTLVLTIGVTFAYFIARTGAGASANTNITADTVDDLKFSVSKENLSLNINQFNFASGAGNISDSITATASLKANSTKKTATGNYYVYFQIESNGYIYTTEDGYPEVVLSVTGPNGEITSLDNLSYVTATNADGTEVNGFDITDAPSSVIKISDSYEISSSSSTNYTNQDWTFTVTFINLNTNQADNEGKTLIGKVLIQQEKLAETIADVAKSGDTLATTLESLGTKGLSPLTNLYHHDGSIKNSEGNVIDAEDNSYRFAGANPNNYVCFGSDETVCPYENLYRIISLINGTVKLISADAATTDMLGTDGGYSNIYVEAGWDLSYYKGKGDSSKIGAYEWNLAGTYTWSDSTTNTINLNTNYLTYLDGKNSKWKTMIGDTTWYVGGMSRTDGAFSNAKTAYDYEVGANKNPSTIITSKIGLMYASDYYYGALPGYWTLPGLDKEAAVQSLKDSKIAIYSSKPAYNDYSRAYYDNWMSTGLFEYTLSPGIGDLEGIFAVVPEGGVDVIPIFVKISLRPTFNLISSIKYVSGSGTQLDPIRLS